MATQVLMPQLGLTMNEGLLTEWAKKEGDAVRKGDVLFSVENDKATLPVEAQADGTLANIAVQEGQTVPVGTLVALILTEGEKPEDFPLSPKGAAAFAPSGSPAAERTPPSPPPEPSTPTAESRPEPSRSAATPAPRGADGFVPASPRARKLAADSSLDLRSVTGSGPEGAVLERDLPASVRAAMPEIGEAAPAPEALTASELVTLSRVGRIGAERMAKSWAETPQFTLYAEACVEELARMQEKRNREGRPISLTVILAGLLAKALRGFPRMNASWAGNGAVRTYRTVDVGIAMDTPDGLVVPVLRDCANKGLETLAREMGALTEKGRKGALGPDDLAGGTITLSNLGMFGVKRFRAIVNPPQTAILAAGAIDRKAEKGENGEILFRRYMEISVTSDHRAVDGAYAARFLSAYKELIENPMYALF